MKAGEAEPQWEGTLAHQLHTAACSHHVRRPRPERAGVGRTADPSGWGDREAQHGGTQSGVGGGVEGGQRGSSAGGAWGVGRECESLSLLSAPGAGGRKLSLGAAGVLA